MSGIELQHQPVPLITEEALRQAIVHHQSGRLQDAERFYRTILQTQPNHPDANHNLGVLAVQVKQPAAALPYLKAALEANPSQGQYWLSYINALIQADLIDAARQNMDLGRRRGLKGVAVDALSVRLDGMPQAAAQASKEVGSIETVTEYPPFSSIVQKKSKKKLKAKPVKSIRKISSTLSPAPSLQDVNALVALFSEGKYVKAVALAEEMTGRYPLHGFGWKVLGSVFQQMGRSADALEPLQKATVLMLNDAEAHSALGVVLMELDRLDEAEVSCRRAILMKADFCEAHNNLGSLLKLMGRLAEAEASYSRALQIKPDHVGVHNNLGNLLRDMGRLNEAVASYRFSLQINPGYAYAHNNLGTVLMDQGQLADAEVSFRRALEIEPDYAEAHYNLGNVLKDVGRLDEAEASYLQALKSKPDFPGVYGNLGNTLALLGRLEEAATCYRAALQSKSDCFDAHNNLGNTLREMGRLDDAEVSYQRALNIKPDFAEAHNNLGTTLKDLCRLDEAETCYRRALQIKPHCAEMHSSLGGTLIELGRLDEAEASCRRALEIKPDLAVAHCNLGHSLQGLGRLNEADASYRRMLEMKSDFSSSVTMPPVTALFPFGRSGSLFFHSLFDGHPEVATLPGVYFKGWFGMDQWKRFSPNMDNANWRERLVEAILKEYQPLFDARCKKNVAGLPMGNSAWLAQASGFMEMGTDRSQHFAVDQNAFTNAFLSLLAPLPSIGQKDCFDLIHRAFDTAIRGNTASAAQKDGHIFYHIHNPSPFELAHFLQHYPQARLLHIVRNPVQSMESWMLIDTVGVLSSGKVADTRSGIEIDYRINCWNKMVGKVAAMFTQMQSPFNISDHTRGVRLEDVKRDPKRIMPQIAAWMGISDHPALYEASFCGLQYWGPASKATGKITGFDTKAIDQPVGRLLGARDVLIFETLFWPLSHLYGYTELDAAGFRRQLAEIRPWLDEPLEFEMKLYAELPDHTRALQELPPYNRLHRLLHQFWVMLDRDGTYHGMVQPLELD